MAEPSAGKKGKEAGGDLLRRIFDKIEDEAATIPLRTPRPTRGHACYALAHGYKGRSKKNTCADPSHESWTDGAPEAQPEATPKPEAAPARDGPRPIPTEAEEGEASAAALPASGFSVEALIGEAVRRQLAAQLAAPKPARSPRCQTQEQRDELLRRLTKARAASVANRAEAKIAVAEKRARDKAAAEAAAEAAAAEAAKPKPPPPAPAPAVPPAEQKGSPLARAGMVAPAPTKLTRTTSASWKRPQSFC